MGTAIVRDYSRGVWTLPYPCSPAAGVLFGSYWGNSCLLLCCCLKTSESYKALASFMLRPSFLPSHSPQAVTIHLGLWLLFVEEVRAGYLYLALLEWMLFLDPPFLLLKQNLSLAWNLPCRLIWLASEPKGLCLPALRLQA